MKIDNLDRKYPDLLTHDIDADLPPDGNPLAILILQKAQSLRTTPLTKESNQIALELINAAATILTLQKNSSLLCSEENQEIFTRLTGLLEAHKDDWQSLIQGLMN